MENSEFDDLKKSSIPFIMAVVVIIIIFMSVVICSMVSRSYYVGAYKRKIILEERNVVISILRNWLDKENQN